MMQFSKEECVVMQAALIRYVESLHMSNKRILRAVGINESYHDRQEKLFLIRQAQNSLVKVRKQLDIFE